ncbi:hypothetical protein FKW77_006470 [Venturia effusa]|uniref:Uncharacterized protein n=1 Tax=Venturia effusa TaxID=50376 RepID=A0A517LN04_9PEZI|nr:hypothetical protein FKW77_006470 [Venturia effusa]
MASSDRHAEASSSQSVISSSEDTPQGDKITEQDNITEQDFASPTPRHLSVHRESGIRSVRQSMYEPSKPKPRWFEQKKNMTFQFKLTPKGRASGAPSAAKVPMANEDGSTTEAKKSESGIGEESSSSSKPPGAGGVQSTRNIPIHELTEDPTAWQRLLTSALFLMKEDHLPKPGQSKVVDLGLAHSRMAGGKHLAMKHHSSGEHQSLVQSENSEAKRVMWKVVVKPAGSSGPVKTKVPMANEDGSS